MPQCSTARPSLNRRMSITSTSTELAEVQGWTPDRYEARVAAAMMRELLSAHR